MKCIITVLSVAMFLAGCPLKSEPKKMQKPVYFWAVLDHGEQLQAMRKSFGASQENSAVVLKTDDYRGDDKLVSAPYLAGATAREVKDALAKLPSTPATFVIGKDKDGFRSYLLDPNAKMVVHEVANARLVSDSTSGQKLLLLKFLEQDKRGFFELTKRIKGKKLAVVVDDEVVVAPIVREAIPGGTVRLMPGVDQSIETMAASMFGAPL